MRFIIDFPQGFYGFEAPRSGHAHLMHFVKNQEMGRSNRLLDAVHHLFIAQVLPKAQFTGNQVHDTQGGRGRGYAYQYHTAGVATGLTVGNILAALVFFAGPGFAYLRVPHQADNLLVLHGIFKSLADFAEYVRINKRDARNPCLVVVPAPEVGNAVHYLVRSCFTALIKEFGKRGGGIPHSLGGLLERPFFLFGRSHQPGKQVLGSWIVAGCRQ